MHIQRDLGAESLDAYLATIGEPLAERAAGPHGAPSAITGEHFIAAFHFHAWRASDLTLRHFARAHKRRPQLLLYGAGSESNWAVELAAAKEAGIEAVRVDVASLTPLAA